jgi:hypothetical protein
MLAHGSLGSLYSKSILDVQTEQEREVESQRSSTLPTFVTSGADHICGYCLKEE